jgi:hypothetical protein
MVDCWISVVPPKFMLSFDKFSDEYRNDKIMDFRKSLIIIIIQIIDLAVYT